MNKLIYILPQSAEGRNCDLEKLLEFPKFLDHEDCAHYWDESLYKKLRCTTENDDRLSQGLRRIRFAEFTDFSKIAPLPKGLSIYSDDADESESIYGRFAATMLRSESVSIVDIFEVNLPKTISILENDKQKKTLKISPIIKGLDEAAEWLANTRQPKRIFNHHYPKHGKEVKIERNVKISPMNLSVEEVEHALSHAIGCKGESRLIHLDREKEMIVVFSYENRQDENGSPIYHGHHFPSRDKSEIERLPQGIIKKISQLYNYKLI